MVWLFIGLFLLMLGAGVHLTFRAYQIYRCKRMEYVADWSGRALKNPESVANQVALVKLTAGLCYILMPPFILLVHLPFGAWQFPVALVSGMYVIWLNVIVLRHAKNAP